MKDMTALIARAEAQGWKVECTTKGHLKFIPPGKGDELVIASGTPGDWRSFHNTLSRLKRAGFKPA